MPYGFIKLCQHWFSNVSVLPVHHQCSHVTSTRWLFHRNSSRYWWLSARLQPCTKPSIAVVTYVWKKLKITHTKLQLGINQLILWIIKVFLPLEVLNMVTLTAYSRHSGAIMQSIWRLSSFNTKLPSDQNRQFHYGDKMVLRPSCLLSGISYTGYHYIKMPFYRQ